MGDSIEQWRAKIGTFSHPRSGTSRSNMALGWIHVVILLLLLCGDVERNPGPTHGAEHTYTSDSADIMNLLQTIQNQLADISNRLSDVTTRMAGLATRVSDIEKDQIELAEENNELQEKVNTLENKVDQLEAQSRRDNLLFYGLPETPKRDGEGNFISETWKDCEAKVKDFIKEKLGLSDSDIEIERAHRINTKNKPRPIIAKFSHHKVKESVLSAAKLLKNTPFSISEDFTKRVRDARRELIPFMTKAREEGKRANLRYDKLVIDRVSYKYSPHGKKLIKLD